MFICTVASANVMDTISTNVRLVDDFPDGPKCISTRIAFQEIILSVPSNM